MVQLLLEYYWIFDYVFLKRYVYYSLMMGIKVVKGLLLNSRRVFYDIEDDGECILYIYVYRSAKVRMGWVYPRTSQPLYLSKRLG